MNFAVFDDVRGPAVTARVKVEDIKSEAYQFSSRVTTTWPAPHHLCVRNRVLYSSKSKDYLCCGERLPAAHLPTQTLFEQGRT
ncbi:MAG: hypothetical protein AAGG53_14830, partial [Cyanobacteria bacterium P01_H01_bin.152]